VRDPSLTLTQFCALLKTVLLCRAYETLPWRLSGSLGCKDCCVNTSDLTYLLTYLSIDISNCSYYFILSPSAQSASVACNSSGQKSRSTAVDHGILTTRRGLDIIGTDVQRCVWSSVS